jgi:ERCC4-related helicase
MEGFNLLRDSVTPREYQVNIAKSALGNNCLVVLPTGLGKTLISILVTAARLEKYPKSKVMVLSPTRPLCAQLQKSFRNSLFIDPEKIILITGKIKSEDREMLYKDSTIVVSTPQCIDMDMKSGRIDLKDFSLITFDEAHRSIGNYSYTLVSQKYQDAASNPLILGLTASPGGSRERIEHIRKNLFIKKVEIRQEAEPDIEKYVQPVEKEMVYVELPEDFKKIRSLLDEKYKEDIFWLRDHHYLQTLRPSKKALIALQRRFGAGMSGGSKNYSMFWAMMKVVDAIKIDYAQELLETQGLSSLHEYLSKMKESKKKTDKMLINSDKVKDALEAADVLIGRGVEHPKVEKLLSIVRGIVSEDRNAKIIIFANYRNTVEKINHMLRENGIKSEILIGQAVKDGKGLTQQEQIEALSRFSAGEFNVLCGTQVSEEGLSIVDVSAVIFFEGVASEIRRIQRSGRTGRNAPGKVIYLLTKDTRDEVYHWVSSRKEKNMRSALYGIGAKSTVHKRSTLKDWAK